MQAARLEALHIRSGSAGMSLLEWNIHTKVSRKHKGHGEPFHVCFQCHVTKADFHQASCTGGSSMSSFHLGI